MCINYLAFIKSAGKPQNSRHIWKVDIPNIKLTVEYQNHNHLSSLDCNVTINKDNLYPSIFRKQSLSLVLSTIISLWIPVSWTILSAQSISINFFTSNGYSVIKRVLSKMYLGGGGGARTFLITLSKNLYTIFFRRK